MFLRHFKTSNKLGHYYRILDLQAVQWKGDANMEEFRSLWDHYLELLQKTDVLNEEIEYISCNKLNNPKKWPMTLHTTIVFPVVIVISRTRTFTTR